MLIHTHTHSRFIFFFFQAEDGIRDYKVTGVQTCALPIWPVLRSTYVGVFPLRCTTSASLRCVRPCTTPTRASGDALAAGSINGAGEAHMSDVILETRNLTKEFKGFTAVSKVDLSVARCSIHAFIGPHGAGKTTCFNLLTKFLEPTSGTIRFNGEDITREDRKSTRLNSSHLGISYS